MFDSRVLEFQGPEPIRRRLFEFFQTAVAAIYVAAKLDDGRKTIAPIGLRFAIPLIGVANEM